MKAIIFDMGNVLVHFDARRAARAFAREAKIPLEKIWRHFFTSRIEKAYTRGEISTREFYQHAQQVFDSQIDFRTFCRIWNEIFWENRGIRPILQKLSRRYPLYLISNTNALHFHYVKRRFPWIFRYFRKSFPSHLVGRRKPDPRIYWRVLRSARLRPEEALFIDDIPQFVEVAKKLGMQALQFRSNAKLRRDLRRLGLEA